MGRTAPNSAVPRNNTNRHDARRSDALPSCTDPLGPAVPLLLRAVLLPVTFCSMFVCSSMFSWLVLDGRQHAHLAFLDRSETGPLVELPGAANSLLARCAWDVLLFVTFALHHAGLARLSARERLERAGVPRRAIRAVYILVTALVWSLLVVCWQRTNVFVWDFRAYLPAVAVTAQELLGTFFVIMCYWTVMRHDLFSFFGFRQLLSSPQPASCNAAASRKEAADSTPELVTTGAFTYGLVRHPMYFYLLAAAIGAPVVLSLDRLLFAACAGVFLHIALPNEEEKLVEIFGDKYRDYQRKRPAFFPFLPAWVGGGPQGATGTNGGCNQGKSHRHRE